MNRLMMGFVKPGPSNARERAVSSPAFRLLIAWALVFLLAWAFGQFSLVREPDSSGYEHFAGASLRETMASIRTAGYPLFLRALASVNPTLSLLPLIQLLIQALSVFCLFRALSDFGAPAAASLWAGVAVAFSALNDGFFSVVGTDSLGQSLALVAVAGCFWAVAKAGRRWPLWVIAVAVPAAYQVRPVYLVLIGFAPCFVLALKLFFPGEKKSPSGILRLPLTLLIILGIPFLLFSAFRWTQVGHFGLVSLGGFNQIGITSEMLTVKSVRDRLPARWTPLASTILRAREEDGIVPAIQDGAVDNLRWRENFDDNLRAALRAIEQQQGTDTIMISRTAARLSTDIIKAGPRPYLLFVARNALQATFFEVINGQYVLIAGLALLILLYFGRKFLMAWLPRGPGTKGPEPIPAHVLDGLAFGAGLLLIMQVLAICPVIPPFRRFMHPAGMLAPPLLGLLIYREAVLLTGRLRKAPRAPEKPRRPGS